MLYLNGSDLETEYGMATGDLIEIVRSAFNDENIHLLILTGGALQWQNPVVPNDTCVIYQATGGDLYSIVDIGQRSIGDAGTLTSFIDFCMTAFPATNTGLFSGTTEVAR